VKKHSFDFPGIIIGIVIGLIFGFLINSRLREPLLSTNVSLNDTSSVYLLQVNKTTNPEVVASFCDDLRRSGLKPVYVREGSYYYVYTAIAKEEEDLALEKTVLDQLQISYVVKVQSLNNYPNNIIGEDEFDFWDQGVKNFLLALSDKNFTINNEYLNNPINAEFHKNLIYLNALVQNGSKEAKNYLLLETYKLIVENLS
jgi:hypothetical protein